jgi:hypothetical protein
MRGRASPVLRDAFQRIAGDPVSSCTSLSDIKNAGVSDYFWILWKVYSSEIRTASAAMVSNVRQLHTLKIDSQHV